MQGKCWRRAGAQISCFSQKYIALRKKNTCQCSPYHWGTKISIHCDAIAVHGWKSKKLLLALLSGWVGWSSIHHSVLPTVGVRDITVLTVSVLLQARWAVQWCCISSCSKRCSGWFHLTQSKYVLAITLPVLAVSCDGAEVSNSGPGELSSCRVEFSTCIQ